MTPGCVCIGCVLSRSVTCKHGSQAWSRSGRINSGREQDAFELGEVRVWEPPVRVVFEMRGRDFKPDERTEVEVRFEPTQDGTRVTVHHTGWDPLPPDHPARHGHDNQAFAKMMGLWWADQLTAVRTFVDRES